MSTRAIGAMNWQATTPVSATVRQSIGRFARDCARRFHAARMRQARAYIARRRSLRSAPGGAGATCVYWL